MPDQERTWATVGYMIMKKVEDLDKSYVKLSEQLVQIRILQAEFKKELQVKSGIFGVLGGFIPMAIMVIIWLVKGGP